MRRTRGRKAKSGAGDSNAGIAVRDVENLTVENVPSVGDSTRDTTTVGSLIERETTGLPEIISLPGNPGIVASTSSSNNPNSVSAEVEIQPWNNLRGHETPVQSPIQLLEARSYSSYSHDYNPDRVTKLVRELIPIFDGKNISVKMFSQHCRAAISMVHPRELPFLTLLVKNKIIGEARAHIQDRDDLTLDDILKTLEQLYAIRSDISQLLQKLSQVKKNPDETIPEYGGRVIQLLNKLTAQVLENNPGEQGRVISEAYKITATGNFMRGLGKELFLHMGDKSKITDIENAIAVAHKADLQLNSWNDVHSVVISDCPSTSRSDLVGNEAQKFNSRKRVAHLRTIENGNEGQGRSYDMIKCFGCQEYGHIKRNCQKRTKFNEAGRETKGCNYCQGENHVYKECRLRLKHERERTRVQNHNIEILNEQKSHSMKGKVTLRQNSPQVESSSKLKRAN